MIVRRCDFVISKPGKDDRGCANQASFTIDGRRRVRHSPPLPDAP